jgi:hypothetical protein
MRDADFLYINGAPLYDGDNPILIPTDMPIYAINDSLAVNGDGSFVVEPDLFRTFDTWNATGNLYNQTPKFEMTMPNNTDSIWLGKVAMKGEALVYSAGNHTLTHLIDGHAVGQIRVNEVMIDCPPIPTPAAIPDAGTSSGLASGAIGGIAAAGAVAGTLAACIFSRRARKVGTSIIGAIGSCLGRTPADRTPNSV